MRRIEAYAKAMDLGGTPGGYGSKGAHFLGSLVMTFSFCTGLVVQSKVEIN